MEREEYRKMAEVEDRMWWYRAMHANLLFLLGRFLADPAGRILDDGCGTGGFLARAGRAFPGLTAVGVDVEPWAAALAREKSCQPVSLGSVNRLPFRDAAFAAVVTADVFCHRAVDPAEATREAFRCLGPGGVLIIQTPAFRWLAGAHDQRVFTARRYTRQSLGKVLTDAGFRIAYSTYWNTLLFPLMVLRRKVFPPRHGESDVQIYPPPVEAVFNAVMAVEHALLRLGLRLPFGGSVVAVGVKDGR